MKYFLIGFVMTSCVITNYQVSKLNKMAENIDKIATATECKKP